MNKIKTGDTVFVLAGKDKGKRGRVLRVFPKEDRAVVEGINRLRKHLKPTPRNPQRGIVEIYGKIHLSNLMLICPSCGKPTRVGFLVENGKKHRYCKKCKKVIN